VSYQSKEEIENKEIDSIHIDGVSINIINV